LPRCTGKPARLTAVKIDITERRKADDALAASEERYRLLFSAMSEAYVVHDIIYDEAGNAVDFLAIEANPGSPKQQRSLRTRKGPPPK
jgi:PAS domain-containing protein